MYAYYKNQEKERLIHFLLMIFMAIAASFMHHQLKLNACAYLQNIF